MNKKNKLLLAGGIVFVAVGIAIQVVWSIKNIGEKPLCYRDSCIGFDAIKYKCNGQPKTLVKEVKEKITLELRYSPSCDASWAKAVVPKGTILYVEDAKGREFGHYTTDDDIPSAHYGNMASGKAFKACAKLPKPNGTIFCTSLPSSTSAN